MDNQPLNRGDAMIIALGTIGFVCFCSAIILYLRSEDTQYHKTHSYIDQVEKTHAKYVTEVNKYITGLHDLLDKNFDKLSGSVSRIDSQCQQASRCRVAVASRVEDVFRKTASIEMHLTELRKEIAKQKMIEKVREQVTEQLPTKGQKHKVIKKPAKIKKIRKSGSHASH